MEKEINHPKHTTLSIKHGSVFWHFMAASGIWPLVFIDDVTADRSSRTNSEVYRTILSAQIQTNTVKLIGQCL